MTTEKLLPLVVDLDGTLILTDSLMESVLRFVKGSAWNLLRLPLLVCKGKAAFKAALADARPHAALLPYREDLLAYLRQEKAQGRQLILATAAHQAIAQDVADHLGLFDQIIATTGNINLKGEAKRQAIQTQVGQEFVYAGDSRADLPIWQSASGAILAGCRSNLLTALGQTVPLEKTFNQPCPTIGDWLGAIRIHQWLKNLLLFIPLLTSFSFFNFAKLGNLALAFVAFSLAASASYLLNDLWDLDNDRCHPRKRQRAFASGRLSILQGLAAAALGLLAALTLALLVSKGFALMLLLYLMLTSAYSWVLREYVIVDVLLLAVLYTHRILAGSLASAIPVSSWLLAFSVFMFLSLALVKRCAELISLEQQGTATSQGRDYRITDLVVLWPLGVGAALSAVVVFGLFISSAETQARYASPQLLWLVALGLIYWSARLWIHASRGEMHDDPVVYAIQDPGSRLTLLLLMGLILTAYLLRLDSLL